jgi:hypothetical protein
MQYCIVCRSRKHIAADKAIKSDKQSCAEVNNFIAHYSRGFTTYEFNRSLCVPPEIINRSKLVENCENRDNISGYFRTS